MVAAVLVLALASPVLAADVKYDIKSQYILNEDTVDVTQEFDMSSSSNLGSQTIRIPGTSESFSVKNGSETVSYEEKTTVGNITGINFKATDLTLDLGSKKQASVVISYQSEDLFADYNKAQSLFAPPFQLSNINSQEVVLSAKMELAIGNIIGAETNDISTDNNQQVYTFKTSGAFDEPIILQMGAVANAEVEISGKLQNDSFWWQEKTVVLPLDTNQQKSYINSIDPKPTSVRVDRDGNIIASYFLAPKQGVDVKAKANVLLEQKSYDLDAIGGFEQLDQDIVADYTAKTSLWPDSVLADMGLNKDELRSGTVMEAVSKVNEAISKQKVELTSKVDFKNRIGKESRQKQSSLDLSDRMVAALRAAGVPARVVGGVITDTQLTRLDQTEFQVWVEVFIPGEGWMTVDPVLNRLGENFFGQSGLQRIGLFIWGISDHIPEFQADTVSVKYTDQAQPEEKFSDSNVKGTNYILLPGISLLHTSVNMPAGYINDEVSVNSNGANNELGSLAPLQTTNSLRILIGEKSWQEIPLKLQIAGATKAQATAGISVLSTIIVVVLLILLIRLMLKWYKKSKAPLIVNEEEVSADDIESQNMLHSSQQPAGKSNDVNDMAGSDQDDDRLRTRRPPNQINF